MIREKGEWGGKGCYSSRGDKAMHNTDSTWLGKPVDKLILQIPSGLENT